MTYPDWYWRWREVVTTWPDPVPPAVPLTCRSQTPQERLAAAVPTEVLTRWLLHDPSLYRLAAAVPTRSEEEMAGSGGRHRLYPEWVLVLFGCLKVVYGSANRAQQELAAPGRWEQVLAEVATVLGPDCVVGLPPVPPTADNWRTFATDHVTEQCLPGLIARFEELAAGRAVEIGFFDPRVPIRIGSPSRLRTVSIDGKVHTSPTSHLPGVFRDRRRGTLRQHRVDPARGRWAEAGDDVMVYGSKFTWAMAQHPMANMQVVLSLRYMPPEGAGPGAARRSEAQHFLDMATRLADLLPGADLFVADGAWRGSHITSIMASTGRMACSRMYRAPADSDHVRIDGTRYKAAVLPRHSKHPSHSWTCPGHVIVAAAGTLWEVTVTEDGDPLATEITRVRNQRTPVRGRAITTARTASGGGSDPDALRARWRWHALFALPCRHQAGVTHRWLERLTQNGEDDDAGFNRGEYLRLFNFTSPLGRRVYGFREAVESLNNTSEHVGYRDRLMSWGAHRQTVDMIMFGLVTGAKALAAAVAYATGTGATVPWTPGAQPSAPGAVPTTTTGART